MQGQCEAQASVLKQGLEWNPRPVKYMEQVRLSLFYRVNTMTVLVQLNILAKLDLQCSPTQGLGQKQSLKL